MAAPTATEQAEYINSRGSIRIECLTVQVRVTDVRVNYGNLELQVTPVSGKGSQWVRAIRYDREYVH